MPAATEAVGSLRRFVDISVPRNIASDISSLESAVVYNVDDLKEVVAANIGERQKAAAEARELLREEQQMFEGWRDSLATVPTIKALRNKVSCPCLLSFCRACIHCQSPLTQARPVICHGPAACFVTPVLMASVDGWPVATVAMILCLLLLRAEDHGCPDFQDIG